MSIFKDDNIVRCPFCGRKMKRFIPMVTIPDEDDSLEHLSEVFSTHTDGKICDNCREVIEREIGTNLFYLASLCNILDINLYDVLIKETEKMNTLGKFTFR